MSINRRDFLQYSAAAGAMLSTGLTARAADSPSEKIVLGIMGVNGRGTDLARGFASVPGNEIAYVCDVDERAIAKATKALSDAGKPSPQGVGDFRKILDDKNVDALVIAAPDHWHGPATILACNAGKHVYVEKPASHNPREGEMMVEAARKHNRVVQLGTQRRSMAGVIEGIGKVHSGAIGKVLFSRGWYNNARGSIGHGKPGPVPSWLDFDLWQGPAPRRDYRDNLVHYNWHWFWHWGTSELGNNGIHALDVCRWGLGVDYPTRVTANGGKYHQTDDQETPDTHVVTYDFGGEKGITWEGRSWHRRGFEDSMFGISFYGDQGTIVIDGDNFIQYDPKNKEVAKGGGGGDAPHLLNFLDCIRTGRRPNADIEEGHKSTLLCHLGNIAYRTGTTLHMDATTHKIVDNKAAEALWGREYEKGWEPKV